MNTAILEKLIVPISAAGSDAATGTNVFGFKATEAFSIIEVSFECDTANPPTGSAAQIDVTKGGTTIFSTNPTIDVGESHSDTAATPPALSTSPTAVAVDDEIKFDIDQIGSTNAGQRYIVNLHILRPIVGP